MVPRRPDAVHVYGVDLMSTGDLLKYFADYGAWGVASQPCVSGGQLRAGWWPVPHTEPPVHRSSNRPPLQPPAV